MAARKLPDHGTYARANGSPGLRGPCKCGPCVAAHRAAKKRHRVNRQLGRSARIDAGEARRHLELLHRTMGWNRLAEATGCDHRTLYLIHNGQRKQISHITHSRIMATRPTAKPDRGIYVDATGTIRRIRALQAIGYSCRAIAEAAHTADARINLIALGKQPTVRQMLAERIGAAYRELADKPVPPGRTSTRSRRLAAAKGWHGPLAWGDDIDDPNARPDVDDAPAAEISRDALAALRRQEIEHLAAFGIPACEIARRVGVSEGHVREVRAGRRTTRRVAA